MAYIPQEIISNIFSYVPRDRDMSSPTAKLINDELEDIFWMQKKLSDTARMIFAKRYFESYQQDLTQNNYETDNEDNRNDDW